MVQTRSSKSYNEEKSPGNVEAKAKVEKKTRKQKDLKTKIAVAIKNDVEKKEEIEEKEQKEEAEKVEQKVEVEEKVQKEEIENEELKENKEEKMQIEEAEKVEHKVEVEDREQKKETENEEQKGEKVQIKEAEKEEQKEKVEEKEKQVDTNDVGVDSDTKVNDEKKPTRTTRQTSKKAKIEENISTAVNNETEEKMDTTDSVEEKASKGKKGRKQTAKKSLKSKIEDNISATFNNESKDDKKEADSTSVTSVKSSEFNLCDFITSAKWKEYLKDEFEKDYFKELNETLNKAYSKEVVYPPKDLIFNAFNLTELEKIKIVIIGQDPYHDKDQAHGLAFSVPKGIVLPPTLKNIYKELENDIDGFKPVSHGCFIEWAKEGVFLLNTILTVREHTPASHAKMGWQKFTDTVIRLISEKCKYCVFILWGNFAHKKDNLIDAAKHGVIKCAHPSPLSFNKFFKSKCFSKANNLLKDHLIEPVNWQLTE